MTRRITDDPPSYEAPELQVLGTLQELTLHDFCSMHKTFGNGESWHRHHMVNCSG